MKQMLRAALLILFSSAAALAQNAPGADGPPVSFPQVKAIPIPLQSTSGRFSSLNPPNRRSCGHYNKVVGIAVSPRLILVNEIGCRGQGGITLVNVELGDPADIAQMIVGRRVTIDASITSAQETRVTRWRNYNAVYLIAEKAKLVAGDPIVPPVPAFVSYMVCQPPELDQMAAKLGRELCVQSTLVANLAQTGVALEMAARTPSEVPPTKEAPGDPDMISCRLDPERSDLHLPAIACARGNYWAWWKRKWQTAPRPVPLAPP